MATTRKMMKKKHSNEKCEMTVFDFTQDELKKELSGSEEEEEEDGREDETRSADKPAKKRPAADFGEEEGVVGNDVQSMFEKFGANISKAMQAKKSRLECLTKNYMRGSQHKLEQLWNNHQGHRQKLAQQYSLQVSSVLQQWETEAHRVEEQEEKLNNLIRQLQKLLQQARVIQNQKLKSVRELYEQYLKNMESMEKNQDSFLQGAQQELKKEMAILQKKILMDTQQQEMATVRKSLQSMLF